MVNISLVQIASFLIFLTVPFIFAYFARRIKISPIVGYIIGGLMLGNFFGSLFSKEVINNFAYFGILLLLFTLGLEINFSRLLILKKFIIVGGVLQILLTILFISLISSFFGYSFLKSFLIGIALSSSSTALVAKLIQDRGEENSFVGEIATGILMFQNIAFIPFLIIFTSISNKSISFIKIASNILLGLVEGGVLIFILFYLGQIIIPKIFNKIAKTSRELLNLFIIIFIFFVIYISLIFKIPIYIGVFIAGILVGQTLEHYHIFSQVRPSRDLLAVIFFVYIGLNIRLDLIVFALPKILLFTTLVIFIKALIVLTVFLILKFHSKTALTLALYLFQIDEDAFILMSTAFNNKVITLDNYMFITTSMLLTLIATPIFIKNKDKIYQTVRLCIKKCLPFLDTFIRYRIDSNQSAIDVISIKNHIIICGYGRVGS